MAGSDRNGDTFHNPPSKATEAVLLASDAVPDGARQVLGIDFDAHLGSDISVAKLVEGMATMGFQATAIGDAVRIINQMVRFSDSYVSLQNISDGSLAGLGRP